MRNAEMDVGFFSCAAVSCAACAVMSALFVIVGEGIDYGCAVGDMAERVCFDRAVICAGGIEAVADISLRIELAACGRALSITGDEVVGADRFRREY